MKPQCLTILLALIDFEANTLWQDCFSSDKAFIKYFSKNHRQAWNGWRLSTLNAQPRK